MFKVSDRWRARRQRASEQRREHDDRSARAELAASSMIEASRSYVAQQQRGREPGVPSSSDVHPSRLLPKLLATVGGDEDAIDLAFTDPRIDALKRRYRGSLMKRKDLQAAGQASYLMWLEQRWESRVRST